MNVLPARLKNLPRDGRDTLFLLAVIAWVILPQIGNLPVWCSLRAPAAAAGWGRWRLLGRPAVRWR